MSSLYQRKNIWHISYYYQGQRRRQSLKTSSVTTARKIQTKFDSDILAGTFNITDYSSNGNLLLNFFIAEAKNYVTVNKSKDTTIRESRILKFFYNFTGNIHLNKVNHQLIWK